MMFSLRQLVVNRLEKQGNMALDFIDLEKACDTVPIQMAMTTLIWMGTPESKVKWLKPYMRTPKQE